MYHPAVMLSVFLSWKLMTIIETEHFVLHQPHVAIDNKVLAVAICTKI